MKPSGGELQLNIKPGLGGVEIVSSGRQVKATIRFDLALGRTQLSKTFEVDEKNGVRIVPSTLLTAEKLKVSQIDKLFGESLRSRLLQSMP